MKKLSQSTKPAKVKERVANLQLVEARYRLLKPVLDHLTLGQDSIEYYAYGVIKAQIFQLTRRAERERVPASHSLYRASIRSAARQPGRCPPEQPAILPQQRTSRAQGPMLRAARAAQ